MATGAFAEIASAVLGIAGPLFGVDGTWGFERPHDLADGTGTVVASLELASAAGLGATALSLRLVGAAAGLAGAAPAGLQLTIAGQVYTLATDARAAGNLLAVTLTSGLLAPAAQSTAVALGSGARFDVAGCVRQDDRIRWMAEAALPGVEYELLVPRANAPTGFVPRMGDILIHPDGLNATVLAIPFECGGAWAVYAGNSSGFSGAER